MQVVREERVASGVATKIVVAEAASEAEETVMMEDPTALTKIMMTHPDTRHNCKTRKEL